MLALAIAHAGGPCVLIHRGREENWTERVSPPVAVIAMTSVTSYVPFNPYSHEEAPAKQRFNGHGAVFYIQKGTGKTECVNLPDGSVMPKYRWGNRHWLFKRFDDGVRCDVNGWLDVTPEEVAIQICRRMRRGTHGDVPDEEEKGQMPWFVTKVPGEGKDEERSAREETEKEYKHDSEKQVQEAQLVGDFCGALFPEAVIEGCAGYGGNSIHFTEFFESVIAIDCDAQRLSFARHNARVYEVRENAIHFKKGDFAAFANELADKVLVNEEGLRSDFPHLKTAPSTQKSLSGDPALFPWTFLSPPWGGENYKNSDSFRMADVTICDVVSLVNAGARVAQNMCVFLPPAQETEELIRLAAKWQNCAHVFVDYIVIGLIGKPKYAVVYFLSPPFVARFMRVSSQRVAACDMWNLAEMLREPHHQIPWLRRLRDDLGLHALWSLATEAFEGDNTRSVGGHFFQALKQRYPEVARALNKQRKAALKEALAKKLSSAPPTPVLAGPTPEENQQQ